MSSLQTILESKAAYRRRLARKPVAEKLRIVEALARRALAIRASRTPNEQTQPKR